METCHRLMEDAVNKWKRNYFVSELHVYQELITGFVVQLKRGGWMHRMSPDYRLWG